MNALCACSYRSATRYHLNIYFFYGRFSSFFEMLSLSPIPHGQIFRFHVCLCVWWGRVRTDPKLLRVKPDLALISWKTNNLILRVLNRTIFIWWEVTNICSAFDESTESVSIKILIALIQTYKKLQTIANSTKVANDFCDTAKEITGLKIWSI